MGISRRDFLQKGAKGALALTALGFLGACAEREPLNVWAPKNNIVMPGEDGFLDEANLEFFMDRYRGAKPFAQEVLGLEEMNLNDYDSVVKGSEGVSVVQFNTPKDIPTRGMMFALGHSTRKANVPHYISFSAYGDGDFGLNNRVVWRETKELDCDKLFSSFRKGNEVIRGNTMYPVTILLKNGNPIDMCYWSPDTAEQIRGTSAIVEYAINKANSNEQYVPIMKGRTPNDMVKLAEFNKIISSYVANQ